MRRVVLMIVVLVALGFDAAANAQSLTLASPQPMAAGARFYVSVELARSAAVKVETVTGQQPVAEPLVFEGMGTFTKSVALTRPVQPSDKLELRYSPSDPAIVRRLGASMALQGDGTAFNTRINAVRCDRALCLVCYELTDQSSVNFDAHDVALARPVRLHFEMGARAAGRRDAKWNQEGDNHMRVGDGNYFIHLDATSQHGDAHSVINSLAFQLPPSPPAALTCQ